MLQRSFARLMATFNAAAVFITSWYGETHMATGHAPFTRDVMAIAWIVASVTVVAAYFATAMRSIRNGTPKAVITINGRRYRAGK